MKKIFFSAAALLLLASFTLPILKNDSSSETVRLRVNGGSMLSTGLSGAEETGMGDPDGMGYVELTLNQGQGTISYMIEVANIDPANGAHIHFGAAGVAGPVVVGLTPPTTGMSSGTAMADKELIKNIRKNPDMYYVNIHNTSYPGGAIRGQLSE
jgi:hypothetical protein